MISKQDVNVVLERQDAREWTIHRERHEKPNEVTWYHRPEPRPGEVFSSYFTRAAKANFAEPLKILSSLDQGASTKNNDLDRLIRAESVQKIAQALGRKFRELEGSCVRGIIWIRMLLMGSRYCPFCLREDGDTPFFRYAWRLNFVSVCTLHGCLLEDKCPHCGALVQFWKTKFDQSITTCYVCGKSLLSACRHNTRVAPKCRHNSLFNTFQRNIMNRFHSDRNFFQKFWRLAWALHEFGAKGEKAPLGSVSTWLTFMKETATSAANSFNVIIPTIQVLNAFTEKLEKPFICPLDGQTFSGKTCYLRHRREHGGFGYKKNPRNIPGEGDSRTITFHVPTFELLMREVTSCLQSLNLLSRYQSWILADIATFLTRVPSEFFTRVTTCNHPGKLVTGLVWAFGKFYGITQGMLGIAFSTSKQVVFDHIKAFQALNSKMGVILPEVPSSTWVERIF